jgi:nicotinate-nucleotide adenylyltransferase
MRVGLYGGTFDPVHHGHVNLALEMKEKLPLDEVWFVPAQISPHKMENKPTSTEHRMRMLQLALADIPGLQISNVELERPAPSYTIDTILQLQKEYPEHTFFLIVGDDSIAHFDKWRQSEEIIKRVPLLVGKRSYNIENISNNLILEAVKRGLVDTTVMEISGTEIRNRLKKNLYCGHLLPPKVLDYIYSNELYSLNKT